MIIEMTTKEFQQNNTIIQELLKIVNYAERVRVVIVGDIAKIIIK